jgi:hypothetical protein
MTTDTTQKAPPVVGVRRDDAAMLLTVCDLYAPRKSPQSPDLPSDIAPVVARVREAVEAAAGTGTPPPDEWESARYSLDGYAREHLIESWREVEGRGLVVIGADERETELRTARDAAMYLAGLASAECAIHDGKAKA